MSKFDGVNAVVWVATTRPSTDSVAWWLTAPNSIHVDCGCPESGTVMLREYTASFTSVKPCLYQPPPGTVIEVAARPAGVKLHVPAQVDRGDRGVAGRHTVNTGGRHAPHRARRGQGRPVDRQGQAAEGHGCGQPSGRCRQPAAPADVRTMHANLL